MTRNQLTGLKVINRALFKAIHIFFDLISNTIALINNITFHLISSVAVFFQSDDVSNFTISGLSKNTILVKNKTVTIFDAL